PVAALAAPVPAVGLRDGQVHDAQLLASLAEGQPAPVARAACLSPSERKSAAGEGARCTAVLDDGSHRPPYRGCRESSATATTALTVQPSSIAQKQQNDPLVYGSDRLRNSITVSERHWAAIVQGTRLAGATMPLSTARCLRCRRGPRMVRHQERRARHRHDLVAARALRVHLTARDALEIRERGLAVRAGVEPCERHGDLLPSSSGSPDDELRAASDAKRRPPKMVEASLENGHHARILRLHAVPAGGPKVLHR